MKRFPILLIAGLVLLASPVRSGPVFDPFLERFQVGTYRDPAEIDLIEGFPSELVEPVILDASWLRSAALVLDARDQEAFPYVTHNLLEGHLGEIQLEAWLGGMGALLGDLETGIESADWKQDDFPLRKERATTAVFHHLNAGRTMQAAALAILMRDNGASWGLSPREVFIWDLRAKYLFRKAGNQSQGTVSSWPTMLPLGPFDTGNAWTLWMAHCRGADFFPLPPVMTSEKWGRHLARISRARLSPAELYESELPVEFQSGIGAVNFKGQQRDAHFDKFPGPPGDNSLQGLWVRGRRLQSGGDPEFYEEMGQSNELLAGWRMDVLRRASELRFLNGQWEQGVVDLELALGIARDGEGHWTTRRRLRQWNEQALVLALAKDDLDTGRRLHDLGLEYFKAKDRDAFIKETAHWAARLSSGAGEVLEESTNLMDQARSKVERGEAPDLKAMDDNRRSQFQAAASDHLWGLWIKWGITLANPDPVQGVKKERAIVYREALRNMSADENSLTLMRAALHLVADRLGNSEVFDRMVAQALDRDVGLASGWTISPEPSQIPTLLPLLSGSELDRHALLGFALAVGDMRGILAVAYELEGRGLTPGEKRRFLYPLPGPGGIYDAIVAADSDPALLLAVARNESLFEPSIRSRAGALGWMQIMPFHYEQRGALPGVNNWRNPRVSIARGDGLLQENRRRYEGDPYRGVAAYNAGPKAASRWEKQLGGTPDRDIYLAWIGYPETRHYVEKVLIDREIYDWIIRNGSSK